MAHTYTKLLTHFIFSTKDRAPNLHPSARAELFPYMLGILRNIDTTVLALNGSADHVHLLAASPPILSIAEAMRVLKANSSRTGQTSVDWCEAASLGRKATPPSASAHRTCPLWRSTSRGRRNITARSRFRRSSSSFSRSTVSITMSDTSGRDCAAPDGAASSRLARFPSAHALGYRDVAPGGATP